MAGAYIAEGTSCRPRLPRGTRGPRKGLEEKGTRIPTSGGEHPSKYALNREAIEQLIKEPLFRQAIHQTSMLKTEVFDPGVVRNIARANATECLT